MVLKVLDLARKRAVTLAEFSHGSGPTFTRYTDADNDVTFESNVYLSRPTMEVRLASYTGMLNENPVLITLPSDSFTDALSQGEAHAPVTVRRRVRPALHVRGVWHGQAWRLSCGCPR